MHKYLLGLMFLIFACTKNISKTQKQILGSQLERIDISKSNIIIPKDQKKKKKFNLCLPNPLENTERKCALNRKMVDIKLVFLIINIILLFSYLNLHNDKYIIKNDIKNQYIETIQNSSTVNQTKTSILTFIHIPKTGGTYIENRGKSLGLDWGKYSSHYLEIFKKDIDKKYQNNISAFNCLIWHIPPRFFFDYGYTYKTQKNLLKELYYEKSFCIVRNPYNRLISKYFMLLESRLKSKNKNKDNYRILMKKFYQKGFIIKPQHYITNEALILEDEKLKQKRDLWKWKQLCYIDTFNKYIQQIINYLNQTNKFIDSCHWTEQYFFTHQTNGDQLCKYILKYETLEDQFNKLMNDKNINLNFNNKPKPYLHSPTICGRRFNESHFYDETKKMIYNYYKNDFEIFGYDPKINLA